MKQPKNLALSGGGILGITHAGVVHALDELGLLAGIESVAGTSAGAIVGTLTAMRCSGDEIKAIIDKTNFASFKDGNWIEDIRGMGKFGIHPGNVFEKFMQDQIERYAGHPLATFDDFKRIGHRNLNIFATCLNTQSLTQFCYDLTPDIAVADAVRASMAVNWFFEAKEINGKIYRDGGMLYNYPLTYLDKECPNEDTVGSCFGLPDSISDNGLKFGDYLKCVEAELQTILSDEIILLLKNPDNLRRSIVCDTHGISALNFDVTASDMSVLFQAGRLATMRYFAKI